MRGLGCAGAEGSGDCRGAQTKGPPAPGKGGAPMLPPFDPPSFCAALQADRARRTWVWCDFPTSRAPSAPVGRGRGPLATPAGKRSGAACRAPPLGRRACCLISGYRVVRSVEAFGCGGWDVRVGPHPAAARPPSPAPRRGEGAAGSAHRLCHPENGWPGNGAILLRRTFGAARRRARSPSPSAGDGAVSSPLRGGSRASGRAARRP